MAKPKRSAHNFNTRLLLALEEGCKREISIRLGDRKAAVKFRHEVNALRASMRDQNRTDWQRYYLAGVYIHPSNPSVVIIKPKTEEFKDALDAAGIPDYTDPPPAPPDTNVATSDQEPSEDLTKDFLTNLRNLK